MQNVTDMPLVAQLCAMAYSYHYMWRWSQPWFFWQGCFEQTLQVNVYGHTGAGSLTFHPKTFFVQLQACNYSIFLMAEINGCLFHLVQCIQWHMCKLGQQMLYENNTTKNLHVNKYDDSTRICPCLWCCHIAWVFIGIHWWIVGTTPDLLQRHL